MKTILRLSQAATRFWVPFMLLVYGTMAFLIGWESAEYRYRPINSKAVSELFNPAVAEGTRDSKPKPTPTHYPRRRQHHGSIRLAR